MSSITPSQLNEALAEHFDVDTLDYHWGELDYHLRRNGYSVQVPSPTGHKVEVYDSNQHEEGNWHTNLFVVLKVTAPDGDVQYFRKTGYYESNDGEYWDGALVEVFPAQQTITVWTENESDGYDNSFDSYGW